MYDSWESRIRLFIKRKKHGRMMLDSIDNGPLVCLTVEENGQSRPKKYPKLTEAQKLQDDCDIQATNIILHGLPPNVLYNLFDKFAYVQGETLSEYYWRFSQLINDMHTIGLTMQQVQVNTNLSVPMFQQGEDPIECINKAMAFLSAVASRFPPSKINSEHRLILEIKQPFKMVESQFNKFKEDKIRVMLVLETEELLLLQREMPRNAAWFKEKLMLAEAQEAIQILDEEQLAFLVDPGISEAPVAQQIIPHNLAF
ncbi:hypothetical protein Tco_0783940 [Tanacetum coccineum]